MPDSKMDMLRVDAVFKGVSVQKLKDYDPVKDPYWKESRNVETQKNGDKVMYMRFGMPMMSDRDMYIHNHIEEIEGGIYMSNQGVDRDDWPHVKGAVRMWQQSTCHLVQDPSNPD